MPPTLHPRLTRMLSLRLGKTHSTTPSRPARSPTSIHPLRPLRVPTPSMANLTRTAPRFARRHISAGLMVRFGMLPTGLLVWVLTMVRWCVSSLFASRYETRAYVGLFASSHLRTTCTHSCKRMSYTLHTSSSGSTSLITGRSS